MTRVRNGLTKRNEYNLSQAFTRIARDLEDNTVEYKITENQGDRIILEYCIKNNWRKTIIYNRELRSIKSIYDIMMDII